MNSIVEPRKWHFIEFRESMVLRSYSDNANIWEWIGLIYLFIPTKVCRRLCANFFRGIHVFAYNGQTKADIMSLYFIHLPVLTLSAVQHKYFMFNEGTFYLENVWNSSLGLFFFQKPMGLWGKFFDLTVVKDTKTSINFV